MAPRDFFVHLVMMYKCTEFHSSRTICRAGLIFLLSMLVQIWFLKMAICLSCHGHTLRLIRKFLITFHIQGLEMIQSEIQDDAIKSLRLVRSNTFGANVGEIKCHFHSAP